MAQGLPPPQEEANLSWWPLSTALHFSLSFVYADVANNEGVIRELLEMELSIGVPEVRGVAGVEEARNGLQQWRRKPVSCSEGNISALKSSFWKASPNS